MESLTKDHQGLLVRVGNELIIGVACLEAIIDDISQATEEGEVGQAPGPSEVANLALLGGRRGSNRGRVGVCSPELAGYRLSRLGSGDDGGRQSGSAGSR